MKIAITGHTKGIGLALYNQLFENGHHVVGFSRSNSYDISNIVDRQKILEAIEGFDVFINNAYSPFSQSEMLKEIVARWESQEKLIVNIGSKSIYADIVPEFMQAYVDDKKSQIEFITRRRLKANPQIMSIVLGLVDTEMSQKLSAKKLNPIDVAKLLVKMIEEKDTIYVQELMLDVPFQDWSKIVPNAQ